MDAVHVILTAVMWVVTSALASIPLLLLAMFCKLNPDVWVRPIFLLAGLVGMVLTYRLMF